MKRTTPSPDPKMTEGIFHVSLEWTEGQRDLGWLDTRTILPDKFFFAGTVPNRDMHLVGWEAGAEEKM